MRYCGCEKDDRYGPIVYYKGQVSASNNPLEVAQREDFDCEYWARYWKQVRTINVFLQHAPTMVIENENNREIWIAEARVLRAFFYLQLVKWFGSIPIITEPFSMDLNYGDLKNSSTVDVFKFRVEDGEAAEGSDVTW